MTSTTHTDLGRWTTKIGDWLSVRALPSSDDPQGTADMTKAALSAIPPSASQAHFADDIVSMCLTMQRSCRKPVSWRTEWGGKPDSESPRNTRTRVVAVARLSSSRKDEAALFAKLQQLVAPTVREVWPVIGREGTGDEAIAGTKFFSRVGSAIAGMEDTGSHAVWEDVIRQELPRADVLLVFGLAGFVLVSC